MNLLWEVCYKWKHLDHILEETSIPIFTSCNPKVIYYKCINCGAVYFQTNSGGIYSASINIPIFWDIDINCYSCNELILMKILW